MLKSSLRYSIYKVQTRFPKKAFELYHTQFRLSRTFFEFFQTFSRRFSLVLTFASNSVILSHLFKLVKHFFELFRSFPAVKSRSKLPLFITQLFQYTSTSFICQELFSVSSKFLSFSALFRCPRGQLAYIIICFPICQAFFNKNWHLFLCTFNAYTCAYMTDFS